MRRNGQCYPNPTVSGIPTKLDVSFNVECAGVLLGKKAGQDDNVGLTLHSPPDHPFRGHKSDLQQLQSHMCLNVARADEPQGALFQRVPRPVKTRQPVCAGGSETWAHLEITALPDVDFDVVRVPWGDSGSHAQSGHLDGPLL